MTENEIFRLYESSTYRLMLPASHYLLDQQRKAPAILPFCI